MVLFRLLVLILSVLTLQLLAQTRETDFSLSGRVVNSVSGEPVVRALVDCTSFGRRGSLPVEPGGARAITPSQPANQRVFTDGDGAFRCAALAAGVLGIRVARPQFESLTESVPLTASKDGLTLRLKPLSSIEGKVVDEDGTALGGINMILYQATIQAGRAVVHQYNSITTDEFGSYRFWNLRPGKYLLRAAGRNGSGQTTALHMATTAAAESAVPIYFGGAKSRVSASPLDLRSGATISADFRLTMRASKRVTGTVTGITPNVKVKFEFVDEDGEVYSTRASLNTTTGHFLLLDALPGKFRLRVTQGDNAERKFGSSRLEVKDSDLKDIDVKVLPGVEMPVRLTCPPPKSTQSTKTPPLLTSKERRMDSPGCFTSMELIDGSGIAVGQSFSGSNFVNVEPGSYRLSVRAHQLDVSSVRFQGREILPGERVEVDSSSTMTPLEVQLSNVEEGTLVARNAIPDVQALAAIVAVPTVPGYSQYVEAAFRRGDDAMVSLAPGDYTIYTYLMEEPLEYHNPDVLRLLKGVLVHISSGDSQQLEIRSFSR